MKKGFTINGKHSYNDFGLEIAKRTISLPKPNRITESVPYQNGSYDFSTINGELTYENRKITYELDISELYTNEMDLKKRKVVTWLSNVVNCKIYDDYDPNFYFLGSLDSFSWTEDFGKGTLTINFTVYPYKFSKNEIIKEYEINDELEITLNTESAHNILPTIIAYAPMTIEWGTTSISIDSGTYNDPNFYLSKENNFKIIGNGTIVFRYIDEVL